jgi:ribosomal protein L20
MPRAKGGPKTRRNHKKLIKLAKGYWGQRKNVFRRAKETVERALVYAYRDRRQRKRDFRRALAGEDQRRCEAAWLKLQQVYGRSKEGRN